VIRYVEIDCERKSVEVKESFLGFIHTSEKNAEGITNTILKQLTDDEINIEDCRSQCYDNAAVMTGHISGVGTRILDINKAAMLVNCSNHSLNLVGVHASKHDPLLAKFFCTVNAIYVFFSRSTKRWEALIKAIGISVKSDSDTRWSAKTQAVRQDEFCF